MSITFTDMYKHVCVPIHYIIYVYGIQTFKSHFPFLPLHFLTFSTSVLCSLWFLTSPFIVHGMWLGGQSVRPGPKGSKDPDADTRHLGCVSLCSVLAACFWQVPQILWASASLSRVLVGANELAAYVSCCESLMWGWMWQPLCTAKCHGHSVMLLAASPLWWEFLFQERQGSKESSSRRRASSAEEQGLGKVTWDPAELQETGLVTIQEGGVCVFLLQELVIITAS